MKHRIKEIDQINRDSDSVFNSFDWSDLSPREAAEKQLYFEMLYTQIYANKKQIALVFWTKFTAITIVVFTILSVILQAVSLFHSLRR